MNSAPRVPFLPFSDRAAKAFGSKRSDPSAVPEAAPSEFTDSARKAFHSNRSRAPKEESTPFPSAFGGTARAPRTEFGESAAMAFGGGGARQSDFDETASSAFGGGSRSGFSGERESSAFGRKQRRPMERPSLPKAPLTAAEVLIAQAGAPSWSNSALSTAPTTVLEVLKNEEVFPTLGSASGKQKPVPKKAVAVAVAPSAPKASGLTLAEKTKVWSDQTDQQRQREAAQHEREALIRAADERQANVFRSYAKQRSVNDEDEDEEDEEY